ncbi:RHS repeat-associated core domain-containing protein [Haloimpatiens massiliensis]|uniref:RHS repeat-associated core domain-containing protein n=1 Tax=Haloimpatiens massiliensis TaxID=1658110 RepID=UPI000C84BD8D|nr:RHS repeat-associated core domain-containing protein [Haloimpatiens massiliensis]
MNLNGAEYYYVRNAQGDIIGLINAQGEKVVSYTYDSWGKLISIEGSLKDTVGEKNPYRYRGYRYDSETGMYYLQNRYYNPEWGRFINADGIIGETGELLGHNLFAYSKNNWANMSDYSGFRPVYTLGEETEAMRAASYAVMNRAVINRTIRNKREKSSIIPKRNQVTGTIRNVIITGIEGGASSILSKIPKAIPIITNRALRRAGREFIVPVKGASVARGIGGIEKIGAIGVALTGVAIWDNYHSGYSNSEAFGRSAIDVLVSAGVIAFGVSNPVGWTMGLGFAAGLAAEALKNAIWKKE